MARPKQPKQPKQPIKRQRKRQSKAKLQAGGITLEGLKGSIGNLFGNLGNKIEKFLIKYNPLTMALKSSSPKIGSYIDRI